MATFNMFNDLPSIDLECEETTWYHGHPDRFQSALQSTSLASDIGSRDVVWGSRSPPSWPFSTSGDMRLVTSRGKDQLDFLSKALLPGSLGRDWNRGHASLPPTYDGIAPWTSAIVLSDHTSPMWSCPDDKVTIELCSSSGGSTWSPCPSESPHENRQLATTDEYTSVYSSASAGFPHDSCSDSVNHSPSLSNNSHDSCHPSTPGIAPRDIQQNPEYYDDDSLQHSYYVRKQSSYRYSPFDSGNPVMEMCQESTDQYDGDSIALPGKALAPSTVDPDDVSTKDDFLSDAEGDTGSDYSPANRTPTKSRCSRKMNNSNASNKRHKVQKSKISKTKKIDSRPVRARPISSASPSTIATGRATACPHCSHGFHTKSALNKHIATAHTRPFFCTFQLYGCSATFGSKNEWKRHVACQHLRLGIWRCDLGSCIPPQHHRGQSPRHYARHELGGDGDDDDELVYNEFNRKDLFTQHLRRMHSPSKTSSQAERDAFNASIEQSSRRCLIDIRRPPAYSVCGYCVGDGNRRGSDKFEGPDSWEMRMEHVGRHLESGHGETKVWKEDLVLRDWLAGEQIIEEVECGSWRLVGLQVQEGRCNKKEPKC